MPVKVGKQYRPIDAIIITVMLLTAPVFIFANFLPGISIPRWLGTLYILACWGHVLSMRARR